MNGTKRKFGLKHGMGIVATLLIVLGLVISYVIATGIADRYIRNTIVEQLEKATGARVELGNFEFGWRLLTARFDGLTLHGREPAGSPPLFHADLLRLDIRIDSLWGRKISLGDVEMSRFSAHVLVTKDGSTNIPGPKVPVSGGAPNLQGLFDLKIARLRLEKGEILWNDARIPLEAKGGNFEFAMNYAAENGRPVYLGQVSWQQFEIATMRNLPFRSNFSAHFSLLQDSLSVTQLQWKTAGSEIDAQATLASFVQPAWTFRYRSQLRMEDLWTISRQRDMPGGQIGIVGDGSYSADKMNLSGRYISDRITLK